MPWRLKQVQEKFRRTSIPAVPKNPGQKTEQIRVFRGQPLSMRQFIHFFLGKTKDFSRRNIELKRNPPVYLLL